jgi:hypothetical protein
MKPNKTFIILVGVMIVLLGGQLTFPLHHQSLQLELQKLREMGFEYRILDNVVEVKDRLLNERRRFLISDLTTVKKPTYEGLPTLTIDLTTLDTNLYNWKYHYHSTIPVFGGFGHPLFSADLNRNGRMEVYGFFQSQQIIAENRIYESTSSTQWELVYRYPELIGAIQMTDDLDSNGFSELIATNSLYLYDYEQVATTSYPTTRKFTFRRYFESAFGILSVLADLDGDRRSELIYRGSEQDTTNPERDVQKLYIAKYDRDTNNFLRIWREQLPRGCLHVDCTGTMTVGDFDGDGFQEVITSAKAGNIYDIEYFRRDSIGIIWTDSISAAGYVVSGDVDGNEVEEFFVGGKQVEPDGFLHLRIYAYERTGNNSFRAVSAINIFPVGSFFVDTYLVEDMNGDSKPELLISFGGGVTIIKGDGTHQYRLDYYKSAAYLQSVSTIRLRQDGIRDLMVSRLILNQPIYSQTEVYRLDSSLTNVDEPEINIHPSEILSQNYPNPLNPETTITFTIASSADVNLTIFDIQGKEVRQLVNSYLEKGQHSVRWDGKDNNTLTLPSGVYFCRMVHGEASRTIKMLLTR